jgi:hypothetical protein
MECFERCSKWAPDEAKFAASPKEGVLELLAPVTIAERDAQPLRLLVPYLTRNQLLEVAKMATNNPPIVCDYLLATILGGSEAVREVDFRKIEHPYWRLLTTTRGVYARLTDSSVMAEFIHYIDLQPSTDYKPKHYVTSQIWILMI